jgi:uncharacterized protein (TIGR00255 family)
MNNLKSMTGFSSVQTQYNNNEVTCEIRSLNSRYLDVSVRLPKIVSELENNIKDIIRNKITRGKIMFSLNFSSLVNEVQNLRIDPDVVKTYMDLLHQLKTSAGIDSDVKLDHLLYFKDIISFEEESEIDEQLVILVEKITKESLDKLNEMRAQEGFHLRKDLEGRLNSISQLINEIEKYGQDNPKIEFERLNKRLQALINQEQIDRNRLELEQALIADKVDITEETVRMRSHIQLFNENLNLGSPIGKKLNFILQEMSRETNTISNKSTIVEISHRVVTLKEEIEKVREQIQNIE